MLKKNWQIQQREAILKRETIPDLKIKLKSGKKKPAWTLAEKKQQLLVNKLSEIETLIPKFLKTELKESTLMSVSAMI